jgi:hypothetical protein
MTASANPRYRLAPRTSSQQSAPRIQNGFMTTFNGIPERLDCRRLMQLFTPCHHHRRRWQPQKASAQSRNSIQYP